MRVNLLPYNGHLNSLCSADVQLTTVSIHSKQQWWQSTHVEFWWWATTGEETASSA